jgi:FtsZ-binding cell division protein ZapB
MNYIKVSLTNVGSSNEPKFACQMGTPGPPGEMVLPSYCVFTGNIENFGSSEMAYKFARGTFYLHRALVEVSKNPILMIQHSNVLDIIIRVGIAKESDMDKLIDIEINNIKRDNRKITEQNKREHLAATLQQLGVSDASPDDQLKALLERLKSVS